MADKPDTSDDMWSITGARLLKLLHLAYDGAEPGLLFAEEYANCVEQPAEDDDEDDDDPEE
jgi:hypothetical protein